MVLVLLPREKRLSICAIFLGEEEEASYTSNFSLEFPGMNSLIASFQILHSTITMILCLYKCFTLRAIFSNSLTQLSLNRTRMHTKLKMATIAVEMILRCAAVCSLSLNDFDIERRPYHKNCGCALHNLKGVCSEACSKKNCVSFPMKKSWPNCPLSTSVSSVSVSSNFFCQASHSTHSTLSSLRIGEDVIANEALSSNMVGRIRRGMLDIEQVILHLLQVKCIILILFITLSTGLQFSDLFLLSSLYSHSISM